MLAVDFTQLVNLTVSGLLTGAVYALIAAGLGMIFGVMRVVNFAQGDFMMLAMYLTWALFAGTVGLDPFLSAPLVFIVFCAFGMLIHWLIIRWVSGRRENFDAQVLATVGLGLIFQNLILLRYSSTPRVVAPSYATAGIEVGDIFISRVRLYASLLSLVVAGLLFLFLNRSRTGRAIRAASENWEAATYMGIDIDRVHRLAFGIGVGLTAVGGAAIAAFQPIEPFVGLKFVVIMFTAVVLGGLGSVGGAFIGGLIIGVIQSVSQAFSSASLSNVYVFAIFLLTLYLRPNGLFGRTERSI